MRKRNGIICDPGLEGTASAWSKADSLFLSQLSRPNCLYGPRVYSCYLWVSLAVNVMDGRIHRIAFLFLGARGRSWDWIDIVVALLSIRAKKCRISLLWLKRKGVADY